MRARGREATRDRILAAAMELFSQRGFDSTTVRNIAERCGLTDPAVYYHFRSKREILDALWERNGTAPERSLDAPPEGTSDLVMFLVDAILDAAADQDTLSRLLVRQVLNEDRTAIALRNQAMAAWRRKTVLRFRERMDEDEAGHLADGLIMLTLGAMLNAQIDHGSDFPRAVRSPEFRAWVKNMTRVALPLEPEESRGPGGTCAQ